MKRKSNLSQLYERWKNEFCSAALADGYAELDEHIEHLGLNCSSYDLLQCTTLLIFIISVYLDVDGISPRPLLQRQNYRRASLGGSFYILTFELTPTVFGRVVTDDSFTGVDFADLFNHPWSDYETAGFQAVLVTRLDGLPIDDEEIDRINTLVSEDMFFDYDEAELWIYTFISEVADTARVEFNENYQDVETVN